MSIVYRKTAKGQTEIGTRAFHLSPRLRQALIMVDGRKTEIELAALLAGEIATTLAALKDGGYIEALVTIADKPAAALDATPRKPARPVESIARDAVRHLTDQLGPTAEGVTLKIERAKTLAELRPLLEGAAQLLGTVRGTSAAQAFAARFLAEDRGPDSA